MTNLRRACLTVPGNDPRKLEKAASLVVDQVVIDLEDSVPVVDKTDDVRRHAMEAIGRLPWRASAVAVRVNGMDTPWFRADVEAVLTSSKDRVTSIVLPKVESSGQVAEASRFIAAAAADAQVPVPSLEALIESALGVIRADAIAEVGGLDAIVFGPGDYAASMELPGGPIGAIDPSYPGDQWAYPRARIAVAARAFGIDAIDGPYAVIGDADGLRESARRARMLGFSGKWVIHPDQIATCMAVFSPTPEEIAAARRTLGALDEAAQAGSGVASIDGEMLDEASRRRAERVLELGNRPT